jgi:hypothetical protein
VIPTPDEVSTSEVETCRGYKYTPGVYMEGGLPVERSDQSLKFCVSYFSEV